MLTGMAPTWARWVYRAGIAKSLHVLAYTPEGAIDSVATRIRRSRPRPQGDRRPGRPRSLVRARRRQGPGLVDVERRRPPHCGHGKVTPPSGDVAGVGVVLTSPAEVPPGLWDGDGMGWLAPLEPPATAISETDGAVDRPVGAVVSAVRVVFEDGRWALMEHRGRGHAVPSRQRHGDARLCRREPQARRPGALPRPRQSEGPARKGAGGRRGGAGARGRGRLGRTLAAGASGGVSDVRQLRAVRVGVAAQGCTLQTQTVRLWVVGVTIGPEDRGRPPGRRRNRGSRSCSNRTRRFIGRCVRCAGRTRASAGGCPRSRSGRLGGRGRTTRRRRARRRAKRPDGGGLPGVRRDLDGRDHRPSRRGSLSRRRPAQRTRGGLR